MAFFESGSPAKMRCKTFKVSQDDDWNRVRESALNWVAKGGEDDAQEECDIEGEQQEDCAMHGCSSGLASAGPENEEPHIPE